ncbi:MAG: phosphoenolpyruvate synthase [Candidatus Woykebacteria bacterium RIFCSPHIGHO2_12_FULL_43_10]|uniref:Phosphoenolpyruvate synthase n=1 Tax=Candidatus Woykebacteria bacterium RIFCSPLOWO2_01_FULL_43_14 TaxID=1802605 RepID=A0A1G1WYL8_9BACT|nr:MAG: phosphoenolpyruvate synthase [Candidatus Woykebacteria bacterium RIFCSPHIGHO2_12_FULL_43_10]OGY32862.1 MAG: phosphoenolpyruvate synthase [Candidatus Woykebacteria bacterium RIFCSPLOWO2_01_FULL_43_14]
MSKHILWFHQIDKHDVHSAGGKGANLGEMTKAGIPVPPGFVVSAQAYQYFIDSNNLRHKIKDFLNKLDPENTKMLSEASSLIKKLIVSSTMPQDLVEEIVKSYQKLGSGKDLLVAVRSSATAEDLPGASFAGQQSTYLNISGTKNILRAVKDCWASLFEGRAIYYREQKKFDHFRVNIAVPIQKMVQSDVSGVMFTLDPLTNDRTRVVVEAIYGLGELIVQGEVTPDHYEVNKKDNQIITKQKARQLKQLIKVGDKTKELRVSEAYQMRQKLSDDKIVELAKLGEKIEKHYFFPQDIEWAMENDELFIVQTRPITTIKEVSKQFSPSLVKLDLPQLLQGASASPGIISGPVRILTSAKDIGKLKSGEVLVAPMTNPDFVPAMRKAVAIVTDSGGKTSHAAIVSRELGIPCVVGTEKATKVLRNGQVVTVNGSTGVVYKGSPKHPFDKRVLEPTHATISPNLANLKTATKVYVNLAEPEKVKEVARRNVDGIGLLRAEFMMAQIGEHPQKMIADKRQKEYIEKLSDGLKTFCEAFDPRPVVYRASDFKTNEYRNLKGGKEFEQEEPNPMIGFRGCFRYIKNPEVFEMELEAIKKVRNIYGFRNLWLMIPFVRTPKELAQVKHLVSSAGLHRSPSFKLWMMVEVPSNVFILEKFLEVGIDGLSIGSNDLTQLILGVDRDSSQVAQEFNELDDAVMGAIEHVIKTGHKHGASVSICGQAPSIYPNLTKQLVQWGITSISVSPDAIESTRDLVAKSEQELVKK